VQFGDAGRKGGELGAGQAQDLGIGRIGTQEQQGFVETDEGIRVGEGLAGDIGEQLVEGVDIRRAEPGLPFFQAREQIHGHWFELITEPGRVGRWMAGACADLGFVVRRGAWGRIGAKGVFGTN
jgi:hypothetical protein